MRARRRPRIKKRKDNAGYASTLERRNAEYLERAGVEYFYESGPCLIGYTLPVRKGECDKCGHKKVRSHHSYKCDLAFYTKSGKLILVECKGSPRAWNGEARTKHQEIQKQYPTHLACGTEYELRFVFSNANAPMGRGAKTTNRQWAEKNGFKCASYEIPSHWITE